MRVYRGREGAAKKGLKIMCHIKASNSRESFEKIASDWIYLFLQRELELHTKSFQGQKGGLPIPNNNRILSLEV